MARRFSPILGWTLGAWVLLATTGLGDPSTAAASTVRFERLSLDDGLPDVEIHHIFQDRRGFLWFATRDGLARYDGYDFRVYSHDPQDETSINGNWIGKIEEDARGRLWTILGVGGIDRLDPKTGIFEHLNLTVETPELSDVTVTDIEADARGAMWITSLRKGVFRYDPGAEQPLRFRAADTKGLFHDRVTGVEEGPDGRIWLATCGGGVSVWDPSWAGFLAVRQVDGLSSDCPTALHADDGGAWIGSSQGLDRVRLEPSPDGQTFTLEPLEDADGKPLAPVAALAEGPDGRLWIGLAGVGLASWDPEGEGLATYAFAPGTGRGLPSGSPGAGSLGAARGVSFLLVDRQGAVWVGTFQSGMYRLPPGGESLERLLHDPADPLSPPSDLSTTALEDRAGNLWLGTVGQGVGLYSPWRFKFGAVRWDPLGRQGLRDPTVRSLAQWKDRVFVGHARGVDALDLPSGEVVPVLPETLRGVVEAMAPAGDGGVWMAVGDEGLVRYGPEDESFRHLPSTEDAWTPSSDRLSALAPGVDPETLWIGHVNGDVDRLDVSTGRVERRRLRAVTPDGRRSTIWALQEDPAGYLWAGAPSLGLFRLDLETDAVRRFVLDRDDPHSLNNRTVCSLHVDHRGRLWVGTYSGGLDLYLPETEGFRHLTRRDGLPSNMVESIVEEPPGVLWAATRHGLARYEPERGTIEVFEPRDGLVMTVPSTGAALRLEAPPSAHAGELIVGGIGGLVRFRPENLRLNPHKPPVVLTRMVKIDAQGRRQVRGLDGVEAVEMRPGDRVLSFSFAALDFADPGRNQYTYRLEGFDDTWVDAGTERSATYTNIDPGTYRFRVRGASADGVWNPIGASVEVRVLPSFWQTPGFRALQAVGLLALIGTGYAVQRRRLVERNRREQDRREHERKTKELAMARRLQGSLLPSSDYRGSGYEGLGRVRTAGEVGGDYFDFMELQGERLCVAVGDAVGHGMASGLVVAMVKAGLLNALRTGSPGAAEVVDGLDRMLRQATGGEKREPGRHPMTMGMAVVMLDGIGRVDLSSVAMPYPYVWRVADRRVETLELGGLPLGRRRGDAPPDRALLLEPGDLLILVSDGLPERESPGGEPWGYERLEETLKRACGEGRPLVRVAEEILRACDLHGGGQEASDDLTIVLVRRTERTFDRG